MTEKRFEMKDPNCWGYPITDNKTGTVYSCNSNIWMKELVGVLNALHEENIELKKELNAFKPFIFKDSEKGDAIVFYSKDGGDD